MKPLRSLVIALLIAFVFIFPANSCGPFFPEAVFVLQTRPDGPYANYARGQLGVPQPGYRIRHLVIAYDWLNGNGLSPSEQQQAVQLDTISNAAADMSADDTKPAPGLAAWLAARKDAGIPVPPVPKPGPGEYMSEGLDGNHALPGASYETFLNCLDPAFATAAQTLNSRKAAYASDAASFNDWVRGQDAVFANCNGISDKMPAGAPAGAPAWLRQDRAYQQAAAKFYQTDYDGAIARLDAIAKDQSSPWHEIAPLVIARAMIRRATIGQITELPPDAIEQPGTPYSQARADAQRKYAELVAQKRPQRFAEARDALRAILANPALTADHADAAGLLDFVLLRLDPAAQAQTLATRLAAPNRPQTPGVFAQSLIDLRYLYSKREDAAETPRKPPAAPLSNAPELLTWIDTMQAADSASGGNTDDNPAATKARNANAAKDALAHWQTTHSNPWLIASLTASASDSALLHAAAEVPQDSPAWTAATYYRLHSSENVAATRTDIAALLPQLHDHASRSTINLFKMLLQRSSPTLDDFLKDAGTLPAGVTLDTDEPDPPDTRPNPQGLCGVDTSQAETPLFDHPSATILNTRMPLFQLAQAAASPVLPRNLRFQIAQSTWTRAVLLHQPEIARRMSPLLIACYPAWQAPLDAYDTATTADDRRITGLLALMRFASTEPIVREGMQRDSGFAIYSAYRDNWWQESTPAKPPSPGLPDGTHATFFGTTPVSSAELPDPPFLTATDRAAAEHEVASLSAVPCASDYFAQAALDWQRQHPTDPRSITALGYAERVVRNGCRTDATRELNHQLFTIVQTKSPNSEWAKKYTTWE